MVDTPELKCRLCGSKNITRNGHNKNGVPQYACKDCGAKPQLFLLGRNRKKKENPTLTSWAKIQNRIDAHFPYPSMDSK